MHLHLPMGAAVQITMVLAAKAVRSAHAVPPADGAAVVLLIAGLGASAASALKVVRQRTVLVVPLLEIFIAEIGLKDLAAPLPDTVATQRYTVVK